MAEPKLIFFRVVKDGGGSVKAVWSDHLGGQFPPYSLIVDSVRKASQKAREALDYLRRAYLSPNIRFADGLRRVAEAGKELRDSLFVDALPQDSEMAKLACSWFEAQTRDRGHPVTLVVHADPILQVPWGLLHEDGPSNADGDDVYSGFWALRFNVAALYNGMRPSNLKAARPHERMRVLSALHQAKFTEASSYLDDDDRSLIDALVSRAVGRAFTIKGCQDRWQDVGDNDCLIHFFGHASGAELHFDDQDRLTVRGFRRLFRRESAVASYRSDASYVLTFLNGCSTSAGEGGESFFLATADPGFCGFVGAEAPVPDRFALLFGEEFLYSLLVEGRSVGETMQALWRKHQPMALFYGCYANPDFRISQPRGRPALPHGFVDRNLSFYHPPRQGVA